MPGEVRPVRNSEREANRAEHQAKLGVEFEQHRSDTRALADGISGSNRRITALEEADAALDHRVTRLEVRAASLVPKGRETQ